MKVELEQVQKEKLELENLLMTGGAAEDMQKAKKLEKMMKELEDERKKSGLLEVAHKELLKKVIDLVVHSYTLLTEFKI